MGILWEGRGGALFSPEMIELVTQIVWWIFLYEKNANRTYFFMYKKFPPWGKGVANLGQILIKSQFFIQENTF